MFYVIWFVTLIAFIVYWRKKANARKMAGENYKSDPNYLKVSKIKRIIGAVCIVSFVLGIATQPSQTPEEKARIAAEQQAKKEQAAAEKAEREAKAKAEKEQQNLERAASLTGDDKALYEQKLQEYKQSMDEPEAISKALGDVDKAIKAREEAAAAQKAAEEKAKADRDKLVKDLESGWDTENLQDNQKNLEKAILFVATNSDYVKNAPENYVDLNDASKTPWKYYGKIVDISGPVGVVTQEPPGHSISKVFDGEYFHTVIQGDFPVSTNIKGMASVSEGQRMHVKGLIVGTTKLTNRFGGGSTGIEFVGIEIH